ncbi:MAG: winged helix-turn-helix domain-containing protein [Proteobacteria bacterium]|nr:winged helix-turn-helix domain-containing protein [Pseudomonadota bacterium]
MARELDRASPSRGIVRAEDLAQFASDAAFVIDQELRILAWNRQCEELLGYRQDEVLGHFCYDVLQAVLPDGQPLCTPDCEAKWLLGRCRPYANRHCLCHSKDGAWVNVQLNSIAVPDALSPDAGPNDDETRQDGVKGLVLIRPFERTLLNASRTPMLRAFTLGGFGLVAGDQGIAVARWERKQALTLLKYLIAARGHAVHRERLIEALWPDAAARQGRERLKVTVYFLRRALRQAGMAEEVVGASDETYSLRRERIWVDADAFEARVNEGRTLERQNRLAEAARRYQEAQQLYRGDYFEENPYADWCAEERERLREIYLDMLGRLAEANAGLGEHGRAIEVCRMALVREPSRESVHRALMGYLARLGRSDEALAQFDHCRRILARELGVEPMPETERVYRKIRGAAKPAATKPAS